MPFSLELDHQKAKDWIDGNFGDRGPYTQVHLEHETAQVLAKVAIDQGISIAEAARRALERGLAS